MEYIFYIDKEDISMSVKKIFIMFIIVSYNRQVSADIQIKNFKTSFVIPEGPKTDFYFIIRGKLSVI